MNLSTTQSGVHISAETYKVTMSDVCVASTRSLTSARGA